MNTMRLLTSLSAFIVLTVVATTAHAADLKLPAPSPSAAVTQTVGVTDITVEYSSPGVKKRKIFGKLVPNDTLWRTGANAATRITLSTDAKIGGQDVPAGTYALFTIPGTRKWTIILNKNADQGGTRKYDESLDQARFEVKPARAPARERMTFLFSDTTDTTTRIDLEWDRLRVSIPVEVDTAKLAEEQIAKAHRAAWRELASAARYLQGQGKHDQGIELARASLKVHEDFYNAFVLARILKDKGEVEEARQWAQKAWDLGQTASYFFWKDQVEAALKDWK